MFIRGADSKASDELWPCSWMLHILLSLMPYKGKWSVHHRRLHHKLPCITHNDSICSVHMNRTAEVGDVSTRLCPSSLESSVSMMTGWMGLALTNATAGGMNVRNTAERMHELIQAHRGTFYTAATWIKESCPSQVLLLEGSGLVIPGTQLVILSLSCRNHTQFAQFRITFFQLKDTWVRLE